MLKNNAIVSRCSKTLIHVATHSSSCGLYVDCGLYVGGRVIYSSVGTKLLKHASGTYVISGIVSRIQCTPASMARTHQVLTSKQQLHFKNPPITTNVRDTLRQLR